MEWRARCASRFVRASAAWARRRAWIRSCAAVKSEDIALFYVVREWEIREGEKLTADDNREESVKLRWNEMPSFSGRGLIRRPIGWCDVDNLKIHRPA